MSWRCPGAGAGETGGEERGRTRTQGCRGSPGAARRVLIQTIMGTPPSPLFRSTAVARVKLAFRTALCLSKRGALKIEVMLGTCVHDASEDKVGSFA